MWCWVARHAGHPAHRWDDGVAGPACRVRAGLFECSAGTRPVGTSLRCRAYFDDAATCARPSRSRSRLLLVRQPGRRGRVRPVAIAAGIGPGVIRDRPMPLVAGLLQVADLPAGMEAATDVQEGTDYDIDDAAFMAQDGIRIVSRTWGMEQDAGSVGRVRLPDAVRDAGAGGRVSGGGDAHPVRDDGVRTDTPHRRAEHGRRDVRLRPRYRGRQRPGAASGRYLFRVGSVVAKVLAGGPGHPRRPWHRPSPRRPRPGRCRRRARPRLTPAAPTPTPQPSPALPLPSGDLTGLLLAHVPAAFASTCEPDSQRLWDGELVTLVCQPPDDDVTVTYSGFDTADHMGAAYQSSLDTIDLSVLSDGCDTGTWTGSYLRDGQEVGQATCWSRGQRPARSCGRTTACPCWRSRSRRRSMRSGCTSGGWGPARNPDRQLW